MLSSRYLSGGWLLVITLLPVCLAIFLSYKLCVYNARLNSNTNLYYVKCVVVALEVLKKSGKFGKMLILKLGKGNFSNIIFKKFQVTRKA